MTCREFADFIIEYLEGTLAADAAERFERHLGVCANCLEYLAQYRTTSEVIPGVFTDPGAPVPALVPEGLIRAILEARKG